jgi:Domain of unknown function (DUF5671)
MNFEAGQNEIQFTSPVQGTAEPIPVPKPEAVVTSEVVHQYGGGSNSALHFFLYLTKFFSLWFLSLGVGIILYQVINKIVPDTAISQYSLYDSLFQNLLQYGLASVIVATPAYFLFSYLITKHLYLGKISENSRVRNWTTFIILFIAVAVMLGTLITFVHNLLGGELILRFFLRALTILSIAGAIFGYYFWDMSKKNMVGTSYQGNKIAALLSLIAISAVFFGSFLVVDSPMESRNRKIDAQTLSSAMSYSRAIQSHYQRTQALPETLGDVEGLSEMKKGESITYKKLTDSTYQLCTNFKTSSPKDESKNLGVYGEKWQYEKGAKCFDDEVIAKEGKSKAMSLSQQETYPPTLLRETPPENTSLSTTRVSMSTTVSIASACRREGGTIVSGGGGELGCKDAKNGISTYLKWPVITSCGANPQDTKWTVFDGDKDSWTITLTCAANTACNGPSNAMCSSKGCDFQGTCR